MMYWYSIHFYNHGISLNRILTGFLRPFVNANQKNGAIQKYFYIRYNDIAPHIRFRFMCSAVAYPQIFTVLETKYAAFIRQENISQEQISNEIPLISESVYEPEVERYGGSSLLPLAESHFELSSKTALSILSASDHGLYSNILALALQSNFILIQCLRASGIDAIEFTEMLIEYWLFYAIEQREGPVVARQSIFKEKKLKYTDIFDRKMDWNKEALFAKLDQLTGYQQEVSDDLFVDNEPDALEHWILQNTAIINKIKSFSPQSYKDQKYIYPILSSLVHMNNNRMGVSNYDESYLAYIINSYYTKDL